MRAKTFVLGVDIFFWGVEAEERWDIEATLSF